MAFIAIGLCWLGGSGILACYALQIDLRGARVSGDKKSERFFLIR
jgi:hypothetical protein